MFILLISTAIAITTEADFTCSDSTPYLNPISFTCSTCPTNNKLVQNKCYCSSYSTDALFAFTSVLSGATCNPCSCENKYEDNGSYTPCGGTNCQSCTSHSYFNGISIRVYIMLACVACPNNQQLLTTNVCGCQSNTKSDNYCVASTSTTKSTIMAQTIGDKADLGCRTHNDQMSCQQLANLCIQSLNLQSTQCDIFNSITATNKPTILPQTTVSSTQLIEDTEVLLTISFKANKDGALNKVPFYIIEYQTDGTVSRLKPLYNQLQICSGSLQDGDNSANYGVKFKNNCDLSMSEYASDRYTTKFYQIFLRDSDDNYIPIPVSLNQESNKLDEEAYSNMAFTYRFFMIDNQNTKNELTYASGLYIYYYMSAAVSDKVYLPYIYILYNTITYTSIDTLPDVTIEYSDNYRQADTSFYSVAGALLIVVNVFVVIIWVIRLWVWSKRNPPYMADQMWTILFFIRAFYVILDTWAEGIFYYLFFMSGYWFCFFKFQENLFVLMPPLADYDNNYKPFEVLFYIMFACRMISTINLVLQQADIEVFFIDWERTEVMQPKELHNQLDPSVKNVVDRYVSKTSAWRTLLIANEFNELSTYRVVSVEWTLFFVGFFLVGLRWINLQQEKPNIELDGSIQKNYILTYFLCNFIYLCVGLSQIIFQKIFDIWFPIQVEDFVDLCSISNISIMIIDDMLHGYYIHGENPIGYAEGSSEHLANCLHYESLGKGKKRGYLQMDSDSHQGDSELQTFEIFLSQRFRESYDKVFKFPVRSATDAAQGGYNEIALMRNPLPYNLKMEEVELNRLKIQFYIKDVLTQIKSNFSKYVRDKMPLQRFLNYPPSDLEDYKFKDQSMPVFYRDPDYSFKKIFFCGNEFFFLITDVIVFNFWMLTSSNVYLSILLSYLFSAGLFSYRQWVGERNLSDQSKIDQRFLI